MQHETVISNLSELTKETAKAIKSIFEMEEGNTDTPDGWYFEDEGEAGLFVSCIDSVSTQFIRGLVKRSDRVFWDVLCPTEEGSYLEERILVASRVGTVLVTVDATKPDPQEQQCGCSIQVRVCDDKTEVEREAHAWMEERMTEYAQAINRQVRRVITGLPADQAKAHREKLAKSLLMAEGDL